MPEQDKPPEAGDAEQVDGSAESNIVQKPVPPLPDNGQSATTSSDEYLAQRPLDRISYMASYTHLFSHSQWKNILLMGTLCILAVNIIPVVPYLVYGGYLLSMIRSQISDPDQEYPAFSFDKLMEYISLGLWPFLAILPVMFGTGIIAGIIVMAAMFLGLFSSIGLAESGMEWTSIVGLIITIGLATLAISAFQMLVLLFSMPMAIRSGLSQTFREAYRLQWCLNFVRKMWLELLLSVAFIYLTSLVLTLAGILALCVGVFVANAFTMLAQAHLLSQIYRLYLHRGGEAVPIRKKIATL